MEICLLCVLSLLPRNVPALIPTFTFCFSAPTSCTCRSLSDLPEEQNFTTTGLFKLHNSKRQTFLIERAITTCKHACTRELSSPSMFHDWCFALARGYWGMAIKWDEDESVRDAGFLLPIHSHFYWRKKKAIDALNSNLWVLDKQLRCLSDTSKSTLGTSFCWDGLLFLQLLFPI